MPTVSQGCFKWSLWRGATLEDFADRLNHFWTTGLLLILACIISWQHNYNNPIQCWVPEEFTAFHHEYAEAKCWYNMYNYVPLTDDIIPMKQPQRGRQRSLYLNLPLILCFQALLFKLPNLFMYIFHGFSGISFEKIASLTCGYPYMSMEDRATLGKQTGHYILNWCKQCVSWLPWRLLTLLWLVVKILYSANIVFQLRLMDTFLLPREPPFENFTSYGEIIIGNMFQRDAIEWQTSPAFPRNVLCDIQIRQFTRVMRYTIQCEVTANHFNELVYMFLWVWFLFVAITTFLSLLIWTLTTMIPTFRKRYIKKALALSEDVLAIAPHDINKFCDIVGEDGIMALKLISANSSELLVGTAVNSMWRIRNFVPISQQGGQILSVPEAQINMQPSAPMASGSSAEAKKME